MRTRTEVNKVGSGKRILYSLPRRTKRRTFKKWRARWRRYRGHMVSMDGKIEFPAPQQFMYRIGMGHPRRNDTIGSGTITLMYACKGDPYRGFDWLLDRGFNVINVHRR